jgi:hypothetical protein
MHNIQLDFKGLHYMNDYKTDNSTDKYIHFNKYSEMSVQINHENKPRYLTLLYRCLILFSANFLSIQEQSTKRLRKINKITAPLPSKMNTKQHLVEDLRL